MTNRMKQTARKMIPNQLRLKIKRAAKSENIDPFKMVKVLLTRATEQNGRNSDG